MNAGDVAIIRFPFSDATSSKKRPALVIGTPPEGANQDNVVVCVEITGSALRLANPRDGDFVVQDWEALSLLAPSVIRCRRLFSVEVDVVDRVIGAADEDTFETVVLEVRRVLHIC